MSPSKEELELRKQMAKEEKNNLPKAKKNNQ
jgi:hypothetical protein